MVGGTFYYAWEAYPLAVISAFGTVIGGFIIQKYLRKWTQRQRWNNIGKDVVLLHSIPHSHRSSSNIGPFNVKLETYLRMSGIKYEIDLEQRMGPKGKTPWITFNGKDYADSQLIIEYLSEYFNKDFSRDLTDEQKAVARGMQIMVEEHLYWGLVSWRFVEDLEKKQLELSDIFPFYFRLLFPLIRNWVKRFLHTQGIGRHTFQERREIMKKDIVALSEYLGPKPFFMGEEPKEIDCCIYGQLCQFTWNSPGSPYEKLIKEECKNLHDYCLRMKERFWSA